MTPNAPTIAHLKTHGLEGFFVTCANAACLHSKPFTFNALAITDEEVFPTIAHRRRFICSRCSGRVVNVMPDWRTHNAPGMGR
jgi:hypothetical protein